MSMLLLFLLQSPAEAVIVLTIDKIAKTAELSGSDTGTPDGDGINVAITGWLITQSNQSQLTFDVDTSAEQFAITGWTLTQPENYIIREQPGLSAVWLSFVSSDIPNGQVTITPLGGTINYSGLSAGPEAWFESLIGGEIPVSPGFGFSPISVVPEPSAFGTLSLAFAGLGFARRRRVTRR